LKSQYQAKRSTSLTSLWPGMVAGEWHSNHHLYPKNAGSGFQPHQVDLAWYYIKLMHKLSAVKSYKDYKQQFYDRYHQPYSNMKAGYHSNSGELEKTSVDLVKVKRSAQVSNQGNNLNDI
jgi:sn-1 stearoyl-lipid 9-desaturase